MSSRSRAVRPDHSPLAGKDRVPVTVVGIGNEYRGDDAVGLMVIRKLKGNVQPGARTIELTGDQSYLLELMRSSDAMIIVDAVQSPAPAGTIFRLEASREPIPKHFLTFSTHSIDASGAIEMARTLGMLPTEVLVYGIVGKGFSYTERITPEVEEAVELIREKIIADIGCLLGESAVKKRKKPC